MSMDFQFYNCREIRKILVNFLETISRDHLLAIPEHFNNNIWWNIAHVAVTHQLLVYKLSGLAVNLPDEIIAKYSKGTHPGDKPSDEEFELIKNALVQLVDKAEEDYKKGIFENYHPYTTSANVTIESVEDAITFNNFHEGIHIGSILALRRALKIAS